MNIDGLYKKLAEVRKEATVQHVNTLIGLTIGFIVIVMFVFGYLIKIAFLLKLGFILGLGVLVILIVAKHIWFAPEEPIKELNKEEKSDLMNFNIGDLGMPSADEYNKKIDKYFK